MSELGKLRADRDKLRAALEKILAEHAPMVPPEGQQWLQGGREEHCRGCDTGDPFEATPWSECLAAQVATEALDD